MLFPQLRTGEATDSKSGLVSGGRFEWIPHTKNLPIACYDAFKGLESVERTQIKQTPGQLLPLPRMASGKLPVLDQILTLMVRTFLH